MDDRPARRRYPSTDRARQLRRNATGPEKVLWSLLRNGRLAGLKFRGQNPIGSYVADFFCREAALVVEVDGASHDDRVEEDARREAFFTQQQRLRVLRVSNDDVLRDQEAVLIAILIAAGREPV